MQCRERRGRRREGARVVLSVPDWLRLLPSSRLPPSPFRRKRASVRVRKQLSTLPTHLPLFSLYSLCLREVLHLAKGRRDVTTNRRTDGRGGRPYLGLEPSNTTRRGRLSSDSVRGWIGGSKRDRTCGMNGFPNISKFRLKNEGPQALVPLSIHGGLKRDERG